MSGGEGWLPRYEWNPNEEFNYIKDRIDYSCQVDSGITTVSKYPFFYIFLQIYDVLNIICCYYVAFLLRNPKKQHKCCSHNFMLPVPCSVLDFLDFRFCN